MGLAATETPRVILVIGPCGAGKTAMLRRMHVALADRVGTLATLETDTFWTMLDPDWSGHTKERASTVAHATAAAAAQFVRDGCDWVVVGSNGLTEEHAQTEFAEQLPAAVAVHVLFLAPSVTTVIDRIADRDHRLDRDKTPEWLAANVEWMRSFHTPTAAVIDNSALSIDGTIEAVFAVVTAERGRVRRPRG